MTHLGPTDFLANSKISRAHVGHRAKFIDHRYILHQTDVMTTLTNTLDNVTSRLDAHDARLTTLTADQADDKGQLKVLSTNVSNTARTLGRRVDQCMAGVANATARFTPRLVKALDLLACQHQQLAPKSGLGKAECDAETPNGPWIIIQVAHF